MTRHLRLAALVSLVLHAAALGVGLAFMHHRTPVIDPDTQAEVQLLMVEQAGSGVPTPGRPPAPQPPPATAAPDAPPIGPPPAPAQQDAAAEPQPPQPRPSLPPGPEPSAPPPASSTPAAETQHPPAASPQSASARLPPAPPPSDAPLQFNLGGTDSESNAIASGKDVIPASIDDKARNKPPIYPPEAVRRGQQGRVVLLIHIGADGLPSGTDILQSSGVASLDEAAQDAVMRWRFLPAVKDGTPVPVDMPMPFIFSLY